MVDTAIGPTGISPAGTSSAGARTVQRSWPALLAAHLVPGALTFGAALLLVPVMRSWSLPPQLGLTLAFALVLTPVELGLLLGAAHRATGRWSLRALPAVLAYRRRLPLWMYAALVPSLTAIAAGLVIFLDPVREAVASAYPGRWLLPPDATAGYPVHTLLLTLLAALLVDGFASPVVEELYFRAYLLPRLPVRGLAAVAVSAGLFTLQHYWQPERFAFILVAQLLLTWLVARLDCVRLSVLMHCLANSLPVLVSLAALAAPAVW